MIFTDVHINTTKTLFENNTFNDYLLIETLQKPYISLKKINTHISLKKINITIEYNIIFKNYEKQANDYTLYYKNSSSDSIDYSNYVTWDSINIKGHEVYSTIILPISEDNYYAFILDYKQINDTFTNKLSVDFSFKFPLIDIHKTMQYYKINDTDLVPNPETLKVVSFNMAIIDETLNSETKAIKGVLYILTKSSFYESKTTNHIFINGTKHYLLGLKETQNSYINLNGIHTKPVFEHFVTNIITNFEDEPFKDSDNSELVFLFQKYYTEQYYICYQETINITKTVNLKNFDYDLEPVNLNTEIPPQKPQYNIKYTTNLIENDTLYVLQVQHLVNVIKL